MVWVRMEIWYTGSRIILGSFRPVTQEEIVKNLMSEMDLLLTLIADTMKIPKDKLKQFIDQVIDMRLYIKEHAVWEEQEEQSDHFDRLLKAEQVTLISLYVRISDLENELTKYLQWFE